MTVTVQALLGLAAIVVSSTVGYLIAKRDKSGDIETSNADALWKESGDIRRELSDQARYWQEQWRLAQDKLDDANKRIATLESQLWGSARD